MCLFSCQFHAVLVTVVLPYVLKSSIEVPPASFFLFDDFGQFVSSVLPLNFRSIYFSTSMKNTISIFMGLAFNLEVAFHNINSPNP